MVVLEHTGLLLVPRSGAAARLSISLLVLSSCYLQMEALDVLTLGYYNETAFRSAVGLLDTHGEAVNGICSMSGVEHR